jgi:hypothetical protein
MPKLKEIVSIGRGYEAEQVLKIALSRKPKTVLIAYETDDGFAHYTWSNMKLKDLAWLFIALQGEVTNEMRGGVE